MELTAALSIFGLKFAIHAEQCW